MRKFLDFAGLIFHLTLVVSVGVIAFSALACFFHFLNPKGLEGFGEYAVYFIFLGGALLIIVILFCVFAALIYQYYYKSRNICPDCSGKEQLTKAGELEKCEKCDGTGTFVVWRGTVNRTDSDKIQTPWWA